MNLERTLLWRGSVPYMLNDCPRCGSRLNAPDKQLARFCSKCAVNVLPAQITIDVGLED